MTDTTSRKSSRGRHPARLRGPTTAPEGGSPRWPERPWPARLIRIAVFVVPIALAFLVAIVLTGLLDTPDAFGMRLARWLLIGVIATIAMLAAQRLMRKLLPLAALLSLTLVFPDETPSRFGIALRGMSARQLERKLADVDEVGLGDTPHDAATSLLELVAMLSRHDRMTRGHSERVRAYAVMIGEEMELEADEIDRLRWAALLHDVGKLHVPYEILNKPEGLTYDEFEVVKQHTVAGKDMVAPLADWLGPSANAVYEHHERWAGGGYPTGVPSEQLALASRIIAVADAFDVMTSARSYKSPVSARAARAELQRCAGTQFDPAVVRAMMNISLGQLWRTMGPLSWIAQIGLFPRPVAQGGTAAGAAAALILSLLLAGLATAATAGRNESAEPVLVTMSTDPQTDGAVAPPPTASPLDAAASGAPPGASSSATTSSTTSSTPPTTAPTSSSSTTLDSTAVAGTTPGSAATTLPRLEVLGPVPATPRSSTITTTPPDIRLTTITTTPPLGRTATTTTTVAPTIVASTTVGPSATVDPTVTTAPATLVVTTVAPTTTAATPPATAPPTTAPPTTAPPTTAPPTTAPPTTAPPTTVPPNDFVLASPGVGDQVHQPVLDLEAARPLRNPALPNFDIDRNGDPGLTLAALRGNIQNNDLDGIQVWRFPATTDIVDGAVSLELWVAPGATLESGQFQMRSALFDCDDARIACEMLSQDLSWRIVADAGQFVPVGFDLTIAPEPYVVAPGRRLELRVATQNGSKVDAWIGYDSIATPSRIVISPPIAAAGFLPPGAGQRSPVHAPSAWMSLFALVAVAYTVRRGSGVTTTDASPAVAPTR